MEIRYTRKLMTSYMRLAEAEELTAWEQKMIANAPVEGVLFAESVWEDGQSELWYDITGKESLETVLGSEMLEYELLHGILAGIYEAVERLERVLLRADALLLIPECIFLDYRTGQVSFCYYPGNMAAAGDMFTQLMEGLLVKLAHEDERAVELAYGVYERAAGGRLNIGELKELLSTRHEKEEQEQQKELSIEIKRELDGLTDDTEARIDTEKCEKPSGSLSGLYCLLKQWQQRWLERLREILPHYSFRQKKREKEEQPIVFEPEPEEEKIPVRPTVLLSELCVPPEGILRYEGEGSGNDIVINTSPFTIGSGQACEGYLPSATVSRRHARITQKEGIYFIEDLNSSNGTYVGGELLDYRTRVSLQRNEIVIFADEKYRFI